MTRATRPRSNTALSRRLGMYFVGVAIGLVLVGFLLSTRRLMVQGSGAAGGVPAPAQPAGPPVSP